MGGYQLSSGGETIKLPDGMGFVVERSGKKVRIQNGESLGRHGAAYNLLRKIVSRKAEELIVLYAGALGVVVENKSDLSIEIVDKIWHIDTLEGYSKNAYNVVNDELGKFPKTKVNPGEYAEIGRSSLVFLGKVSEGGVHIADIKKDRYRPPEMGKPDFSRNWL